MTISMGKHLSRYQIYTGYCGADGDVILLGFLLAVPLLLVLYDRWVRPTWLGAILNGRRYRRGLPATEHVTSRNIARPQSVIQATR